MTSPSTHAGWWRDASAITAWGLVVFVVELWLGGGALGELGLMGSAADAVTSVGRLCGLLASVLILIQVAIMARIPRVEQAWGQDELARVHRLVGFTSFSLMLAHIALTILGYAMGTGAGVVATFLDEVLGSPGMLLALAGAVALVMVVFTSIRRARARLRYESWHLLHLYAYLGAGLALPHQLWTGQDFRASTVATVFWWGLYAAVLASVVAFRVVLPLIRSRRHALVVSEVVAESTDVVSVVMEGRDLDRLPARAGQFFQWRFLGVPGWTRANPLLPVGGSGRPDAADQRAGRRRLLRATRAPCVLVFSYHTSRSSVTTASSQTGRVRASHQSVTSASSQSEASSGTFTGDEIMTRYGVMQVQITVAGGEITAAEAVQFPMADRHDS